MWALLWGSLALASPTPTDAVVAALLHRHEPTPCDAILPAQPAERIAALVEVAESVVAPPWVPMRAATCVGRAVETSETARGAAERWLGDEKRGGLALNVLRESSGWRSDTAVRLARAAIVRGEVDARFGAYARKILAGSPHEGVRGLLDPAR